MICGHVTCAVASPRGLHQPREQRIANVIGQRRALNQIPPKSNMELFHCSVLRKKYRKGVGVIVTSVWVRESVLVTDPFGKVFI